jgi:hypothetical protein
MNNSLMSLSRASCLEVQSVPRQTSRGKVKHWRVAFNLAPR